MGSYSAVTNQSSTNYTNAPITQSDVTNPVNLTNASNVKVGSYETVSNSNLSLATGSSYVNNSLDGGAIEKAFSFGSQLVSAVADLTKSSNAKLQNQSGAGVVAALDGQVKPTAADSLSTLMSNKTLILAAAIVGAWFIWVKK